MPVMTRDHLIEAVTNLQAIPGALVSAVQIMEWCRAREDRVDYGSEETPVCIHFWNADLDEARTDRRLLKFKTSGARNARNHWGLAEFSAVARHQAAVNGWVEVPWDPKAAGGRGNWDWKNAEAVPE